MCCTPFCNSVQRHEKTRPFQLSRSHQPLTPARLSRVYPAQRQPAMQPRARSNCPAMSRARRALPLHHLLRLVLVVTCVDATDCAPPKRCLKSVHVFFGDPSSVQTAADSAEGVPTLPEFHWSCNLQVTLFLQHLGCRLV
jgi:hypothetical protein